MDDIDLIFNEELIKSKLIPFDSPDRDNISDEYFTPSAVLFSIIPYEDKSFELVLIHRTERGRNHRGEMSFPGGKVESGDKNLIDTALRECREEIGVPRSAITLLGTLNDFPTLTKYIITPIVGYFNKDLKLVKDDREVQEIVKVPIDFFMNKKHFREQAVDIGDNKFPIFYFNYKKDNKKYTIWGATAYMIATFIDMVFGINLSKLKIRRFTTAEIKPFKKYIELRKKIMK
ncbi:MAG: NUDIX hydrolase [Promethearchaeota archaeon]